MIFTIYKERCLAQGKSNTEEYFTKHTNIKTIYNDN